MDIESKNLIIKNIPVLKEVAAKLKTYQPVNVDLLRIVYYLMQFENHKQVEIMISLLRHLIYIDSSRMTYLLKRAYNELDKKVIISPIISTLGSIQDSSAVVCYQLLKELFDDEKDTLKRTIVINSLGSHIEEDYPTGIVFFDDNITSGTQLEDFFEELINGKDNPEIVNKPLTPGQYEILKSIPLRVCYAIQLTREADEKVSEIKQKYSIDLEIHSGQQDFNNYLDFQSQAIPNQEAAEFAKDFISKIAASLYQDKEWTQDKLYHRLLGYGNLGKLTAFYYNVPKSFIPVFWKYGMYNGRNWIPLLPETKEAKKMKEAAVQYEFERMELATTWINNAPDNRKPDIKIGFIDAGITSEILLQIPSAEFLLKRFPLTFGAPLTYQSPGLNTTPNNLQDRLYQIYQSPVKQELTTIEYCAYRAAVDVYNKKLQTFVDAVRVYIFRLASRHHIKVQIANEGNLPASDCAVKLIFDSDEIVINGFWQLEKPTFDLDPPKVSDFDKDQASQLTIIREPLISFTPLNHIKTETLELGGKYNCVILKEAKITHNNSENCSLEIVRINPASTTFEIAYEINFQEDADTTHGSLKINYEFVDFIDAEKEQEINRVISNFKDFVIKKRYGF